MTSFQPYTIYPSGDTALTIDFGNRMDAAIHEQVIALFYRLTNNPVPAVKELVPAYSTLTVYYDFFEAAKRKQAGQTVFEHIKNRIDELLRKGFIVNATEERIIRIPVCYDEEFAPDLETIVTGNTISREEIIRIHSSASYKVFMLGFLPGFAYMGIADEKISYVRKSQPVPVPAGSVGIAGRQTGIYPLDSPGGWQIIGRTPMKLFNKEEPNPVLLKAGDSVQFYSITRDEFEDIKTRHS